MEASGLIILRTATNPLNYFAASVVGKWTATTRPTCNLKYSYSWANYIVINVQLQACKAKSYIVVDFVDKKLFFFAVSVPATTMLHLVTSTNGDMNDDLESWNQNILES